MENENDELPERLHGLFERGDTNKDGVLSKDELRKLTEAQSGGARRGSSRRRTPPNAPAVQTMIRRQ